MSKKSKEISLKPPVLIVATIGPALTPPGRMEKLERAAGIIWRLNAAHGSAESLENTMAGLKKRLPQAQILLDLPGRKIRLTRLDRPLNLQAGQKFSLPSQCFNFPQITRRMSRGEILIANDGTLRLKVLAAGRERLNLEALTDGRLIANRGVHASSVIEKMPVFSERDRELVKRMRGWPVNFAGLSFVTSADDIKEAQRLLGSGITVLPKIETPQALSRLLEIFQLAETFILDRGDLASQIGLENLPDAQDQILIAARRNQKKIIVATQLLKSMENQPIPVIAELTEINRLLKAGVYGLQLSEETAIGRYPLECVELIAGMSRRIAHAAG